MKKLVSVAALIALAVVGCQKTEVINQQGGPSLSFSTGMGKLTKAVGDGVDAENSGIENLENQDFSVWAFADPNSDFSSVTNVDPTTKIYDNISNLLVECKTASVAEVKDDPNTGADEAVAAVPGVWKTGKEYYWPGDSKKLIFFAVSANGTWLRPTATGATCPVEIAYATPSLTINDFEVKATANEDLMVADYVIQDQSQKQVDLTFRHTLAKVEFLFKTLAPETGQTAPDVWVQSLQVAEMQYKGDLVVTQNDGAWNFKWHRDEATTPFTDDWTEKATYIDGVEATAAADETAMKLTTGYETFTTWLMMPQNITEDTKVSITYVINKRQFTSIFPLNGDAYTTINAWTCNQHIKYNVILAPNVISFKPIVQDWTTPSTDINHEN